MSNPFLLFAQIVLSLTVPARIPDGSTRVTTARLYGVCAPRLLHYVDAWTAPPPSSTTTTYIRSSSYADHFSGHVSGPPVNTMSNPFLLFAQIRLPDTPGGRGMRSASPRIYHRLEAQFRMWALEGPADEKINACAAQ
ncbi:uncharacterized protein [Dermacentor albipictus]|uniref:uncharacterized protein n=1 Tax=Dermacentor albipictus TaxID=60249 RepID=UPI0038FC6D6A